MALNFRQAKNHVIPFGIWKGHTVDGAAEDDEGLRWLGWIRNKLPADPNLDADQAKQAFLQALKAYLSDKTMAAELKRVRKLSRSTGEE